MSGYGQTVMIDHKDGFISVYARNARLLVKLGDHVYKGDAIAEVGQIGSRVVEHFEIRHGNQATNPLYYLP
jgi:septal ring factor EnvC (AmiA/AmiB activator)